MSACLASPWKRAGQFLPATTLTVKYDQFATPSTHTHMHTRIAGSQQMMLIAKWVSLKKKTNPQNPMVYHDVQCSLKKMSGPMAEPKTWNAIES